MSKHVSEHEAPVAAPEVTFEVKPQAVDHPVSVKKRAIHERAMDALIKLAISRAVSTAASTALAEFKVSKAKEALGDGATDETVKEWIKSNEETFKSDEFKASAGPVQVAAIDAVVASFGDGSYADTSRESTADPLLPFVKIVLAQALVKNWGLIQSQDPNAGSEPPKQGTKEHTAYTKVLEKHFGAEKVRAKAEALRSSAEL